MNRSGFRIDGQPTPDNHYTVQGDIYQGTRNNLATDDSDVDGGNLLGLWTHKLSGGGDVKLQMYYDRTDRNIPQIFGENRDTFDIDFQQSLSPGSRHDITWGLGVPGIGRRR